MMMKNDTMMKLGIFFITIGLIKCCYGLTHILAERRDNNASR